MIGYHYTTKEAWKRIRREGLMPQPIDRGDLYSMIQSLTGRYPAPIRGNWVWERPQTGIQGLGHVLMVHSHHPQEKTFVELMVEFNNPEDTWCVGTNKHGKQYVNISHNGDLAFINVNIDYHKDEPVKIVTSPIPPEKIVRLESYNFYEAKRQLMIQLEAVDTSAKSDILEKITHLSNEL